MGGRRDSNPQQPEPQSGALPLSYGHHKFGEAESKILVPLCKQRARLFPCPPLIVSAGGPETPQAAWYGAAARCNPLPSRLACRNICFHGHHVRSRATGRPK